MGKKKSQDVKTPEEIGKIKQVEIKQKIKHEPADDGDQQKMDVSAMDVTITEVGNENEEYEHLCTQVNQIAKPLASRKLAKKLYKLVRKASKAEKGVLKQGIADVMKAFRRNETGMIIMAGNVSPIDVYTHIPAMCEERSMDYVFTPSREHLGLAAGHKRPAIVLLIKRTEAFGELFDQIQESVRGLVVEEWEEGASRK